MEIENNGNLEIVHGSLVKTFIKFTLPNMIGFIAMSSSAIVDGIFVGKFVGPNALAAINIVIPMMTLVYGVAIMLSIGGAVRVGKNLGEHKVKKASITFTNIHITIAVTAIVTSLICIVFGGIVVKILGANNEIAPYAVIYLRTMAIFFIFQSFEYSLSAFVRVDGNPYLASIAVILGAFINCGMDYLLIVVKGYGIIGAAISTGISYTVATIILLIHFSMKRGMLRFIFGNFNFKEVRSSAYNGLSELLSEMSAGVVAFLFNWVMIIKLGTKGVAAFTVINYSFWFVNMLCYSIGDSLVPLISVNFGALKGKRIIKFLKIALCCVICIGIVMFIITAIIPEKMVGLFINPNSIGGKETFGIALTFASFIKWAYLFSGSSIILAAYFTAIHRPLHSVIIAGSRGLWFPVIFLIILPLFMGTNGIYLADPLAEFITIIVGISLYFYSNKKMPELRQLNKNI